VLSGEAEQLGQGVIEIVAAGDGGGSGREEFAARSFVVRSFSRHRSSLRVDVKPPGIVRPRLPNGDT
jgi:hypothetical protein